MASQLAGATQIVVAIGDLTTPNANTVNVLSGGTIAVTILSGNAGSTATGGSSNINVVQVAGAVVPASGTQGDAVATTSSGTLPTQTFLYSFNGTSWDRVSSNTTGSQNTGRLGTMTGSWDGSNWSAIYNQSTGDTGIATGKKWLATGAFLYLNAPGGGGNPFNPWNAALGASNVGSVNTEGTRSTYSAAVAQAAFSAASGTDVFLINGSATAVVRVSRIEVSFTSLQPVNIPMSLVRRSAVTTAGTSAQPAMIIHDTSNAAASAVVVNYTNTAGQVPGTPRGPVRSAVVSATLASVGSDTPWVLDFSTRNTQAMILRGTSEVLALTISSGAATAGASNISVDIEWSEALA